MEREELLGLMLDILEDLAIELPEPSQWAEAGCRPLLRRQRCAGRGERRSPQRRPSFGARGGWSQPSGCHFGASNHERHRGHTSQTATNPPIMSVTAATMTLTAISGYSTVPFL